MAAFSLNENIWILIKILLNFVPKGQINSIPALSQIMAWRRQGDKPLFEPMMVSLLTDAYMCHSASDSSLAPILGDHVLVVLHVLGHKQFKTN